MGFSNKGHHLRRKNKKITFPTVRLTPHTAHAVLNYIEQLGITKTEFTEQAFLFFLKNKNKTLDNVERCSVLQNTDQ